MRNFGYACVNVATGKTFTITNIALKLARKDPKDGWEKQNTILYPIDENGARIRTAEEIGNETLSVQEQAQITKIKKEAKK